MHVCVYVRQRERHRDRRRENIDSVKEFFVCVGKMKRDILRADQDYMCTQIFMSVYVCTCACLKTKAGLRWGLGG